MRRRNRRAAEVAPRPRPHAQLKLIHAEVDRELSDNISRQSNALTRASFLLAVSGVLTIVTSDAPATPWHYLVIASGALASAFGLKAVWLWKSKAAVMNALRRDDLLRFDEYSLEYGLVRDKLDQLAVARKDLDSKNRAVLIGFIFLIASWLASAVLGVLQATGTI
jgi:hypothetical protein